VVASSTTFPRAQRLLAGSDFALVFAGAERSSDRFFTVLGKLNELTRARLGLAISRKVAPRAVDRNRLRRLARESFRQLDLAAIDFVVMAKKPAVETANPPLRSSLDRHFLRLNQRIVGL
jgi:ribonuclease P protein component